MNVILGGGLAGLSAAYLLSQSDRKVVLVERESSVGGLAKTVNHQSFRFDLGGHRFLTKNETVRRFVTDILAGDILTVPRKSRIYLFDRLIDYPLKPVNAVFGVGFAVAVKILADYLKVTAKTAAGKPDILSMEDWVVSQFGQKMFDLYFKEYSEKVWGVSCKNLCMEWVAKRIEGLSLGAAIKNAFFKFSGQNIDTLADAFSYPPEGIGQIAESLRFAIEKGSAVLTDTKVTNLYHENFLVKSASVVNRRYRDDIHGSEFLSSIPLPVLVRMLKPLPPEDVLEASYKLRYRDIMIVTIFLERDMVMDLTWMYLPDRDIPFSRIHEPKRWSPRMAADGTTHIVAEYFCFKGDSMWNSTDEELTSVTVKQLAKLGLIKKSEVLGSRVVRVPKAYPIHELGYREPYGIIMNYLKKFQNLHIIGRTGRFEYLNMDSAIQSGMEAAESILGRNRRADMDKKACLRV